MQEPETVARETIYQAIYILPRGQLRKELIGFLRQGHKLHRAQGTDRQLPVGKEFARLLVVAHIN